jgi:hypothetical protein
MDVLWLKARNGTKKNIFEFKYVLHASVTPYLSTNNLTKKATFKKNQLIILNYLMERRMKFRTNLSEQSNVYLKE